MAGTDLYEDDSQADEGEALPVVAATAEEVLEECRDQAREEPIRLSTLGSRLGPSAGAYLKGQGLKLKGFLERYPEFILEGSGGCVTVTCQPGGRAKQGVPATPPRQSGPKVAFNRSGYPLRPGLPDCDFYVKSRWCHYRDRCCYNHPEHSTVPGSDEEPALNKRGLPLRPGEERCNFYMKTGRCDYGDGCKWHHPELHTPSDSEEEPATNTCGLPLRPGEGPCQFYMRTGRCDFGGTCKYDHPERQTASDSDEGSDTAELDAYVFHAGQDTVQDCWTYGVLAAPHGALRDMRRNIHKDTLLFLYVKDRGAPWQLIGPFHALLDERLGCLEPEAFDGDYPAQVRIAPAKDLRTMDVDTPLFRLRAPGRKTPEEAQDLLDALQTAGKVLQLPWGPRRRPPSGPREEPASSPSSSSAGDEPPLQVEAVAELEPALPAVPARPGAHPQAWQVGTRVFVEVAADVWQLGTVVEADGDVVSVAWDGQDPESTSRLQGASVVPVQPAGSDCEEGDQVFARFYGQWYAARVRAHVPDEQQTEVLWDSEYSRSRVPCTDVMPRLL